MSVFPICSEDCENVSKFKCVCAKDCFLCEVHVQDHLDHDSIQNITIRLNQAELESLGQALQQTRSALKQCIKRVLIQRCEALAAIFRQLDQVNNDCRLEVVQLTQRAKQLTNALEEIHTCGFLPTEAESRPVNELLTLHARQAMNASELSCLIYNHIRLNTEQTTEFRGHTGSVWATAISPNGELVASASADGTAKVWHWFTGNLISTLRGHSDEVVAVGFHPAGEYVATGSADHQVKVWAATTGELLKTLTGHVKCVTSVQFFPQSDWWIASASMDHTLLIWNFTTNEPIHRFDEHTDAVWAIEISVDQQFMASTSDDQTLVVVKISSGEKQVLRPQAVAVSLAFTPDTTRIAAGCVDGHVRVWGLDSAALLSDMPLFRYSVWALAYLPTTSRLVAGGHTSLTVTENGVSIWSKEQAVPVTTLGVSRCGRLFVGYTDGALRILSSNSP